MYTLFDKTPLFNSVYNGTHRKIPTSYHNKAYGRRVKPMLPLRWELFYEYMFTLWG